MDFFNELFIPKLDAEDQEVNRFNFPLPYEPPRITSEGLMFFYSEHNITVQGRPYCVIPMSKIKHLLTDSVRELLE